MSYIKQDEGGGGDTYTLKAAQSGADVDIQLDAAAGADSDVKLKAGTNITLTEASDTVTIDSAGAGGSIGVNQVAFGDPLNAGDIKGSNNFTFVDESAGAGADVKISGDRPTFTLEDDTQATDYKSIFRQSGASGYWVHADSTGVDRQMIRVAANDIIINESGVDVDVRIEGTTNQNLLRTNAVNDEVGIGVVPTSGEGILQVGGVLQVNDKAKIGNATIQEDTTMKLHVVGSDANLCIEDQDDGSSSGPSIRFSRISASPAASDVLGQMTFRGNQVGSSGVVGYGSVRQEIVDPAAGTKTGRMVFRTINSNTQSDKMQIDSQITSLVNHNFQGLIKVNNQAGTAGQVLTSQGPSSDPIWAAGGGGAAFAPTPSVFRQTSPRTSLTGLSPYGFGDFQNSNHSTNNERIYFAPFIAAETVTIDTLDVYTSTSSLSSTDILLGIYTSTEVGSGASFSRCPDALQMTATAATTVSGYSGGAVSAASGGSTTINQGELYYVAYAPVASSGLASSMQTISTNSRCLIGISVGNAPQTVLQYLPYSYGDGLALSFPTTYLSSTTTTGSQPLHMMYTV